jgi:hypothetical protein
MSHMEPQDIVRKFQRGQNLEQIGDTEGACSLYEEALEAGFDATGPYDRLIALYGDRARHSDVVRVSEAALANVHTYADKRAWYEQMRGAALKAQAKVPKAAPRQGA